MTAWGPAGGNGSCPGSVQGTPYTVLGTGYGTYAAVVPSVAKDLHVQSAGRFAPRTTPCRAYLVSVTRYRVPCTDQRRAVRTPSPVPRTTSSRPQADALTAAS